MNEHELDSYTTELMTLICEDVADEREGGTSLWTNVQRSRFDPRFGYLQIHGFVNLRRIAEILVQQGWNTAMTANVFTSRFDGWEKAEPDEPTFTLLARDSRAPNLILQWSYERERDIAMGRKPESDREMVAEARRIVKAMLAWHREHRE